MLISSISDWPQDYVPTKTTGVDSVQASVATDYEVTRQILLQGVCTVPPWNNIWGHTEAGQGYNRDKFDRYSCWKGMGMGSCDNRLGYWHYHNMPGCNWWVNTFPREVFNNIFSNDKQLRSIVEDSSLLFSSS